jgi:membrane protein CcdC involved in cytochrome C biogenesis
MSVILPLVIVVGILAWVVRPGMRPSNTRRAAVLAAVVPSFIVAIAAVAFQLGYFKASKIEVAEAANICFVIGIGLIGAGILSAAGFAIAHKGEIAKGLAFGTCMAVFISVIELVILERLGGV